MSYKEFTTILLIISLLHVIADSIFVIRHENGDHYFNDFIFYGSIIVPVLLYSENFSGLMYLKTMGMCFVAIGVASYLPMFLYLLKKKRG